MPIQIWANHYYGSSWSGKFDWRTYRLQPWICLANGKKVVMNIKDDQIITTCNSFRLSQWWRLLLGRQTNQRQWIWSPLLTTLMKSRRKWPSILKPSLPDHPSKNDLFILENSLNSVLQLFSGGRTILRESFTIFRLKFKVLMQSLQLMFPLAEDCPVVLVWRWV